MRWPTGFAKARTPTWPSKIDMLSHLYFEGQSRRAGSHCRERGVHGRAECARTRNRSRHGRALPERSAPDRVSRDAIQFVVSTNESALRLWYQLGFKSLAHCRAHKPTTHTTAAPGDTHHSHHQAPHTPPTHRIINTIPNIPPDHHTQNPTNTKTHTQPTPTETDTTHTTNQRKIRRKETHIA